MTLACFQVASSCILPSIITAPLPSGMASRMRLAKATSPASGLNTRLAMPICEGCSVQAPAQPSRKALRNWRLAGLRVGEIAERAVEGLEAVGGAGVDHLGDGVVPEILLGDAARLASVHGVRDDLVFGVTAAHAGRLHGAGGREVGRAQAHAVHAGRGARRSPRRSSRPPPFPGWRGSGSACARRAAPRVARATGRDSGCPRVPRPWAASRRRACRRPRRRCG